MMTPKEIQECRHLLSKLSDAELMSLKDTVTKRQIAVEDRDEAIKAILEYSSNAAELLRRKKIRRDLLFQYLASKSIIVAPNAEKHVLVRNILVHWGSQLPVDGNLMDIDSSTCLPQSGSRRASSESGTATGSINTVEGASAGNELVTSEPEGAGQHVQETRPDNQVMGEAFVTWFYKLLNAENPTVSGVSKVGEFGPQHFWENSCLRISSVTPNISDKTFTGSTLVSQRLKALVKDELLLFNPNISKEGVRTVTNPHGLFMVMVCGTIHQQNSCLGIFEQMFGLVRDPGALDNWKIKVTNLHVVSSQVRSIPEIRDSAEEDMLAIADAASIEDSIVTTK